MDDFRDEEPGKIIHEQRFGEMTAFEERPHSPYYGAADTTPLFLVLARRIRALDRRFELVRELEPKARAALELDRQVRRPQRRWLRRVAAAKRDGLENQCWKDSWNSILFADGTLSTATRDL